MCPAFQAAEAARAGETARDARPSSWRCAFTSETTAAARSELFAGHDGSGVQEPAALPGALPAERAIAAAMPATAAASRLAGVRLFKAGYGSRYCSYRRCVKQAKERVVTYVIGEPCIDVKDRSCVDVCPVDCIHEVGRMLVIDPEECIDCGACEPECPVEAIFPEEALPAKWEEFTAINAAHLQGADVVDRLVADYCERNELPPIEGHRP
jgi:NAD-dependent dihydropyrimidine dehydrogenase PreA subunit